MLFNFIVWFAVVLMFGIMLYGAEKSMPAKRVKINRYVNVKINHYVQ